MIYVMGIIAVLFYLSKPAQTYESNIYVTAAHLDSSTYPNYTLLYSDEDKDIAYYLKNDFEYYLPKAGSRVKIGDSKYKVTGYQSDYGFYAECSDAYKGMSGMRVYDSKGNEIGYVSSYKDGKGLLCISICGTS